MKFFKHTAALALGFMLIAGSVFAQGQKMMKSSKQDSITNKQLKKFANVTNEVQKLRMESNKKVQQMLADKDMDMKRLQQIMMSKRNPKMADSVKMTDKEKATMKEIQPKLQKMQEQSRQKMMGAMQDNGLTPQQFQQIMRAVQSDPAVMKRFQKIAQDSMKKK